MKQVTGKINTSESRNQVSIQLKLGGHSFSVDVLSAAALQQDADVEAVVYTAKTTLVPREEFDSAVAEHYLEFVGMACTPDQCALWSDADAPIVAVMAVDRSCVETLRDKLGARVRFTSPLLLEHNFTTPTIWFCHADGLLYIKVYTPTALRFAEVVSIPSQADILYYIESLSSEFLFSTFHAHITGDCSREIARMLRNYFPKIVCA